MEQLELQASKRDVLGKKVRFLRRQGITPVNLYGPGMNSIALQIETKALQKVVAQATTGELISLRINDAKRPRKVVVHWVQIDPRTDNLLHVDFYEPS